MEKAKVGFFKTDVHMFLTLSSSQGVCGSILPEKFIPFVECLNPENSVNDDRQVLSYKGFERFCKFLISFEINPQVLSSVWPEMPVEIYKQPKVSYILSKILRDEKGVSALKSLQACLNGDTGECDMQSVLIPTSLHVIGSEYISVTDIVKNLCVNHRGWVDCYLSQS